MFIDFKPYKNPSDCNLGIILQYSVTLIFLSALLIKVDATSDSANDQEILGYFLMLVLLLGPIMITFQYVGSFVKMCSRSKAQKLAEIDNLENDYLKSIGLEGVDEISQGITDTELRVVYVIKHVGVLDDETKVDMARWCKCGCDLGSDAIYCRKCGSKRPMIKANPQRVEDGGGREQASDWYFLGCDLNSIGSSTYWWDKCQSSGE